MHIRPISSNSRSIITNKVMHKRRRSRNSSHNPSREATPTSSKHHSNTISRIWVVRRISMQCHMAITASECNDGTPCTHTRPSSECIYDLAMQCNENTSENRPTAKYRLRPSSYIPLSALSLSLGLHLWLASSISQSQSYLPRFPSSHISFLACHAQVSLVPVTVVVAVSPARCWTRIFPFRSASGHVFLPDEMPSVSGPADKQQSGMFTN